MSIKTGSAAKIKLDNFDDLFGSATGQDSSMEQILKVPLDDLHTFKNHPFRVTDDEKNGRNNREYSPIWCFGAWHRKVKGRRWL